MLNQLQRIFEINQLDLKLLSFRDELEKIPQRLGELESMLGEKKGALETVLVEFSELEKNKRSREVVIEGSESRMTDLQGNLSAIKTNKEYQAALKEISESKKNTKVVEEQILQMMTDLESLKKEKEELEQSIQTMKTNFEKEKSDLSVAEVSLSSQINELENSKKGLMDGLEPSVLAKYDRIRKIRREAISIVEGGTCRECNMRIAPQLVIEIQKLKDIYTCPSCHRILYLEVSHEA